VPKKALTAGALAAAAAGLAAIAAPAACRRPSAPAVVLISLDTLRRDRLNCYGYQARKLSPNIDALAADSVVFDSAVAAAPWTTPSHMTLLTSLVPSSHGIMTPFTRLLQDLRNGTVERLPEARTTLAEALASRGFATAAFTGGVTLDPAIGFAQGFSRYDVSMFKVRDEGMAAMKEWVTAQDGRPFFLFWHTFETHAPYLDTSFVREVAPEEVAREVEAALDELGRHFGRGPVPPEPMARLQALQTHHHALSNALYDGGVRSADRRVGELLQFLRAKGRYDRTLIVLTSDHGEELWDRGESGVFGVHGHSLYEEMVGVPLLVKLPGQSGRGTRVAPPAPAVDVMPTVLDVLGIPRATAPQMEGRSLRPMWEGREPAVRLAFTEALAFDSEQKSVRTDRYKYVVEVPAPEVERHGRRFLPEKADARLYDLRGDPGEKTNLLAAGPLPAGAPRPSAGSSAPPPAPDGSPGSLAQALDDRLRRYVVQHFGSAETATLPADTIEKLKALGYVR
jgi:arylsulfatase A-like enzyme